MGVLRAANLDDENVRIAGERIPLLMDKATEEIGQTKDLNVQPRLDSMYEEVQRMVEELSERETIRDQMEKIYGKTPPADIPWNIESPPGALVELVETGQVQPCKTIDMGCGAGNYAIYLGSVGFDVTGVDISPSASRSSPSSCRGNSGRRLAVWRVSARHSIPCVRRRRRRACPA